MDMNGLIVQQSGQFYSIMHPNGVMLMQVYMGNDGNFMLDAKCIEKLTLLMARRWHLK